MIYGYVRIATIESCSGKETDIATAATEDELLKNLYDDYSHTFDLLSEDYMEYDETENKYLDANCNPKMSREEFLEQVAKSADIYKDAFCTIQFSDSHVQYEPFKIA